MIQIKTQNKIQNQSRNTSTLALPFAVLIGLFAMAPTHAVDYGQLVDSIDKQKATESVDTQKAKEAVSGDGIDYQKAYESVDKQKAYDSVDKEKVKSALGM